MNLFHYTDQAGYDAIRSQPVWRFLASQPPGKHPFGAYVTTLGRNTKNLAQKLRLPRSKVTYFFEFTDAGDLTPLAGGRGQYIFYSPADYEVDPSRQVDHGAT